MRRIIATILALLAAYQGYSQHNETSKDTVKIQFGGEFLTLPMPKDGNKVTVNFEDSTGVTQISIGKTNKINKSIFRSQEIKPALVEPVRRRISWFNQLEFGLVAMMGQRRINSGDTVYESGIVNLVSASNTRATQVQVSPKKFFPGLVFGLSIREKSRYLPHSKVLYTTGSHIRYTMLSSSGSYQKTVIKADYVNGIIRYYPDSIYSLEKGDFRSVTNMYQLILPFDFSYKLPNREWTLGLGFNLTTSIISSKVKGGNGEDLKSGLFPAQYIKNSVFQFYPQINVGYKKWKFNISTSIGRTIGGFGASSQISGRMTYFTMGYKLY